LKLWVLLGICLLAGRLYADEQEQVAAGRDAFLKGDLVKAIEILKDATKKEKKNSAGFILLGEVYLKADSADQAIAALVQGREIDPNNAHIYELLGDAYSAQKIATAAIDQYKHATEIDSTKASLFMKLAEANRGARKYNDAAAAYGRVLMLDSANAEARKALGTLYVKAKQWAAGARVLERYYPGHQEDFVTAKFYCQALSETKQSERVLEVGDKLLKQNPNDAEVTGWVADANKRLGKSEEVIKLLGRANLDSMKIEALLSLAKSYRQLEQWEKAAEVYEKALAKDSTRCDIYYELGSTDMKLKKYEAAIALFERRITCDTSTGYRYASHLNMAMSLMQLKRFRDAKAHAQSAIELKPENVQGWVTRAQTEMQLEQTGDAIGTYKRVIELALDTNATNGDAGKFRNQLLEAYRTIGIQLLIDKKYPQSIEYLKKALQLNPNDVDLTLWLGQAYQNSNNKEDAKKYYCKLIANFPKSKQAEQAKAYLELLSMTCD
jgi:tetratricopeptide (TPR) repeat protein